MTDEERLAALSANIDAMLGEVVDNHTQMTALEVADAFDRVASEMRKLAGLAKPMGLSVWQELLREHGYPELLDHKCEQVHNLVERYLRGAFPAERGGEN